MSPQPESIVYCKICGKGINILTEDPFYMCLKCRSKPLCSQCYDTKSKLCDNCAQTGKDIDKRPDKQEQCGPMKISDPNQYKNIVRETRIKSKGMIKEIRCTCHRCGHIWHYLESDKTSLASQSFLNSCVGCSTCCSPFSLLASNKADDLNREIKKLDRCPKCNSSDVTKQPVYHEKRG